MSITSNPFWFSKGWVQNVLTLLVKRGKGGWQIAPPLCPTSKMSRRWMSSKARFLLANGLSEEAIEFQSIGGRPPDWTDAHRTHSVPAEVQPPRIAARVKKSNVFSRAQINRALPRAFAQRTGDTGQSQIDQQSIPAGVKRNNVIDVESGFLSDLSQAAGQSRIRSKILCR